MAMWRAQRAEFFCARITIDDTVSSGGFRGGKGGANAPPFGG